MLTLAAIQKINEVAKYDVALAESLLATLQDTSTTPVTLSQLVPQATAEAVEAEVAEAESAVQIVYGPGKLSQEQIDAIIVGRRQDVKIRELAAQFGVSKTTINYHTRKGRINGEVNRAPGRAPIDPALQRTLQREYSAGNTSREKLARKYDVSVSTVKRYTQNQK